MRSFELKYLLAGGSAEIVNELRSVMKHFEQQKNVVENEEATLEIFAKGFMSGKENPEDIEYQVNKVNQAKSWLKIIAEEALRIEQEMFQIIG